MKKNLLLVVVLIILSSMLYFNYQSAWEEKQETLNELENRMQSPLPDFTSPAEITIEELEEPTTTSLESPFNAVNELVVVEPEEESEDDEETQEPESETEIDPFEEFEQETEFIIKLQAVVGYFDKRLASLEINNEVETVSEGDVIEGLLVEDILKDKVILSQDGEEIVVEMYD